MARDLSLEDFYDRIPSETKARRLLESMIWGRERPCPGCGVIGESWALKGKRAGRGLYECRCGRQFTVTTATPMHGTKLPLRTWLLAMYLMLTSSKGISSVKLGQLIGTSQKTAWKVGHAIREMMALYHLHTTKLSGHVEVDEKGVGGVPRFQLGVVNKRGRGSKKQPVLVMVERHSGGICGQVRAALLDGQDFATIAPLVRQYVHPRAHLMTDENSVYAKLAPEFAGHSTVNHSRREYARGPAHNNTAESFNALIEKANKGVFHLWHRKHLQRYLDELCFRWNHRKVIVRQDHFGVGRIGEVERVEPLPFLVQLRSLLSHALGR